jgi:hypothetical protein
VVSVLPAPLSPLTKMELLFPSMTIALNLTKHLIMLPFIKKMTWNDKWE